MNRDGTSSELDRDREDAEDRERLFVQQVTDVLRGMGWKPKHPVFGGDAAIAVLSDEAIRHLAPRMAAALQAAAPDPQGTPGFAEHASMHWRERKLAAGLAALAAPEPQMPWEGAS